MKVIKRISPLLVTLPALILALSVVSFAQEKEKTFADVKIKNFGQLDERFYRGARLPWHRLFVMFPTHHH